MQAARCCFQRTLTDAVDVSGTDVLAPVVPMFHAMCWGIPFCALMLGARFCRCESLTLRSTATPSERTLTAVHKLTAGCALPQTDLTAGCFHAVVRTARSFPPSAHLHTRDTLVTHS